MNCKKCPEYNGVGQGISSCTYSCKKVYEKRANEPVRKPNSLNAFVKTFYLKTGIYIYPSTIIENEKLFKQITI